MTRPDEPVVGMCKNCGKPVRANRKRGYIRDEHGRVSHRFNCNHKAHEQVEHMWEAGQDQYGGPALICKHCGYVWKAALPKPIRGCTPLE